MIRDPENVRVLHSRPRFKAEGMVDGVQVQCNGIAVRTDCESLAPMVGRKLLQAMTYASLAIIARLAMWQSKIEVCPGLPEESQPVVPAAFDQLPFSEIGKDMYPKSDSLCKRLDGGFRPRIGTGKYRVNLPPLQRSSQLLRLLHSRRAERPICFRHIPARGALGMADEQYLCAVLHMYSSLLCLFLSHRRVLSSVVCEVKLLSYYSTGHIERFCMVKNVT